MKRPLLELASSASFDWLELGDFPTRIDRVELGRGELYVKRDDLSSPVYGGNKVRTLETLFGEAKARGVTRIYSTGAFGSNHATAMVLHAPRVGLETGVILFPQPESAAALRALGRPAIAFSPEMQAHDMSLKAFLRQHMYRHYKVNRMTSKARRVVKELFALYLAEPECLPTEWSQRCDGAGSPRTARLVADFIAGMTDRFALEEHIRLFDPSMRTA